MTGLLTPMYPSLQALLFWGMRKQHVTVSVWLYGDVKEIYQADKRWHRLKSCKCPKPLQISSTSIMQMHDIVF